MFEISGINDTMHYWLFNSSNVFPSLFVQSDQPLTIIARKHVAAALDELNFITY
jgi:hypothetical protein